MKPYISQIYELIDATDKQVVFLDRDGTIIRNINYLTDAGQIEFLPGVVEGIKKLNAAHIPIIIITNQSVIARGLVSIQQVKDIHDELVAQLHKQGAYINAVYFCPHHPNADIEDYRTNCLCRKPNTALFKQAIQDFSISIHTSVFAGDTITDVQAGETLGIPTYFLTNSDVGEKTTIDTAMICYNFLSFVDKILI